MTVNVRKVFLLGFNPQTLQREQVTTFLDEKPHFLNWLTVLPGQVFIVAESTVNELASIIREHFPGEFIFIAELSALSTDGWLPKDVWEFINHPSSVRGLAPRPPVESLYKGLFKK
jgi:hypothetical protein